MYEYDPKENLLTLYKIKNMDMGGRFNVLKDIREAYHRFEITKALEVCDSVINEYIKSQLGPNETFTPLKFSTVWENGFRNEGDHIKIKCSRQGDIVNDPIDVVRLPYMDELGKLHFYDSPVKMLVNKLVSADDISYDIAKKVLSIVTRNKTIRVNCDINKSDIKVQGIQKNSVGMSELIHYLSCIEDRPIDPSAVIINPLLQTGIYHSEGLKLRPEKILNDDKSKLVMNITQNPDYAVDSLRDSINSAVTLDRALGFTLSRKVLNFEPGTIVTATVLKELKKERVNAIYVENITPFPKKKLLCGLRGETLCYTFIPAGTLITPAIVRVVPVLSNQIGTVLQQRVMLKDCGQPVIDFTGELATRDALMFLKDMGLDGVQLSKGTPCSFELEIISNYTVKCKDVFGEVECLNKGIDPEDWMGTIPGANSDKLTSIDLLAIYSTIGFMLLQGVNLFLDRDDDFLKKVQLADVSLGYVLESVLKNHCKFYGTDIMQYYRGTRSANAKTGVFAGVPYALKKQMTAEKLIETPDMTNIVAELSQASHITSSLKNAPETVRMIAVPYYGRICPFETPEGKNLGLTNNKAIGCRIKNGNLLVPVREVHIVGDEITIGDEIHELSVKDEANYRITDILSLTPSTREGYYKNTRVIAVVPNPDPLGEKRVYARIYAQDLNYVFAHTECGISLATSMIPCASSDDAVRVSFGTKMIKSAIYLLDPDRPRVSTFMYKDLFNEAKSYLLRAEKSGTVVTVTNDVLVVMYDGDNDETVYRTTEFRATHQSVVFMRYRVGDGDRFQAGDILIDCSASTGGYYCPGKSELIAYIPTGYNHEDALHVAERTTLDYVSVSSPSIEKALPDNAVVDRNGLFKYYRRGDIITEIMSETKHGTVTTAVKAEHDDGIWYGYKTFKSEGRQMCKIDLLGYNRLGTGDKMSGLHGNKGVDALVQKNSKMPMLANGMMIRIIPNPHGLPSRMNVGQIMEAHLGLIATVLGIYIRSDPFNGATLEDTRMLMHMAHELANCGDASRCRSICSSYGMPEELIKTIEGNMPNVMKWANTFDEDGNAKLWDPAIQQWLPFKVTIGVSTFLKMEQEAETKIADRGGIFDEEYKMTTSQPTQGGKRRGGQSIGVMESWALMAYGASELLHETWNEKSDNECARTNCELEALGVEGRVSDIYNYPRATYNLIYYLQSYGLHLTDDAGRLPDTSASVSQRNYVYDVKHLVQDIRSEVNDDDLKAEALVDTLVGSLFGGN